MDEDEIRETRILNGVIAGDKIYTEQDVKSKNILIHNLLNNTISKSTIKEIIRNKEENIETILNSANYGDNYTLENVHDLEVAIEVLKELLESE